MIVLKILLIIISLLIFLYLIWNIGLCSAIVRPGEFGVEVIRFGVTTFVILVVFLICLGILLFLLALPWLMIFKILFITLTVIWGITCVLSSYQIWQDVVYCLAYYGTLIICIGITILIFKI